MLKTLDILIGATTVVLIFSMAVTVITQALTTIVGRRGRHLRDGLTDLLQQLGIYDRDISKSIAGAVLTHPLFSEGKSWWGWGKTRLGTVISREDFTRILLDAAASVSPAAAVPTDPNASPPASSSASAAPTGATPAASPATVAPATLVSDPLWKNLDKVAASELVKMLKANGISDPAKTLKNVRDMALQLEASNPELASDVRQSLALINEAKSDYVARVNSWFDQTIERVGERFTKYTHYVTVGIAAAVVLAVQLDIIAVIDRLSVDDAFRNTIVKSAIADFGEQSEGSAKKTDTKNEPSNAQAPETNSPVPAGTTSTATATQPSTASTNSSPTPVGATASPAAPDSAAGPGNSTATLTASSATTATATTPEAAAGASATQPAPSTSTGTPSTTMATAAGTTGAVGGTKNTGSSGQGTDAGNTGNVPKFDANKYYNDLSAAGLITLPLGYNWVEQWSLRKVPGMLIAILLVSLGAPFWYNILKDLLGLRSSLAQNDDVQRATRQTTQDVQPAVAAITAQVAAVAPAWLKGERGDLGASG
ncbi:MAG: hypothetical protein WCC87_04670 [Candidatus Korobacteraceae bacterium]